MNRKRFGFVAIVLAILLGVMGQPASAEPPETVSITFALTVHYSIWDEPAELSDFVGEDTLVIITAKPPTAGMVLYFDPDSPDCDGVEVADSSWMNNGEASIVNKGGPITASTYINWSGGVPPAHTALLAEKITDVHACWLSAPSWEGSVSAQDELDFMTANVFILVTGEFRVID